MKNIEIRWETPLLKDCPKVANFDLMENNQLICAFYKNEDGEMELRINGFPTVLEVSINEKVSIVVVEK